MTNDLNLLVPGFKEKATKLIQNCKALGYEMRPSETLRDPFVQAKYWRQSRAKEEVLAKIQELKSNGAPFLAHCIESIGPQNGPDVTNAIPGYSWHQFGEAMDCFWVVNGKAVWDLKTLVNGKNGYAVYADEATKLGLDAGFLWKRLKDSPHVQLRATSNPGKVYSLVQIDQIMKERFGG